ncbi:MAG: DUF6252 family protein [Flavobacterium sp.]
MKKFRLLVTMWILCAAAGFIACENEPLDNNLLNDTPGGGNNNNNNGPALFKVDIDGQPFVANTTMASIGNGLTSVGGVETDTGATVTLTVQGTTTGTYNAVVMTYSPSDGDEFGYANFNLSTGQISGTVTISSINTTTHTLSGTFSFTGWYGDEDANMPPVQLTNGVFTNIPYQTGAGNPDQDSLTATVDGTPVNYVDDIVVTYTGPGQFISIGGVGSNHTIYLIIKDDLTQGTYSILPTPGSPVRAEYTNSADEDFPATLGTLVITSKTSTRIAGTFSYSTDDPEGPEPAHTITNGTFDVEYDF